MEELEKYKICLFMVIRTKIMGDAWAEDKTEQQISDMVLRTIRSMFNMLDWDRSAEIYQQAMDAWEI